MTGREWQPGDVALVDSWRGAGQIAFRVNRLHDRDVVWCVLDGADTRGLSDDEVRRAQRVAVIAYEDREQVERLMHLFPPEWNLFYDSEVGEDSVRESQAALREFVTPTPPKPDEPTGLGAVVEDADGIKWVAGPGTPGGRRWESEVGGEEPAYYKDVHVARVLKEGYEAGEPSC